MATQRNSCYPIQSYVILLHPPSKMHILFPFVETSTCACTPQFHSIPFHSHIPSIHRMPCCGFSCPPIGISSHLISSHSSDLITSHLSSSSHQPIHPSFHASNLSYTIPPLISNQYREWNPIQTILSLPGAHVTSPL